MGESRWHFHRRRAGRRLSSAPVLTWRATRFTPSGRPDPPKGEWVAHVKVNKAAKGCLMVALTYCWLDRPRPHSYGDRHTLPTDRSAPAAPVPALAFPPHGSNTWSPVLFFIDELCKSECQTDVHVLRKLSTCMKSEFSCSVAARNFLVLWESKSFLFLKSCYTKFVLMGPSQDMGIIFRRAH